LKEAQLQGAQLNSAQLQGADLSKAQLQGAELTYANLQGADLRGAALQGADLSYANLQGADLRGAQLQGAKLEGVQLQAADMGLAEVWLVTFPRDLAGQSPAPLGVADLKMAPLTAEAKAQLKQELNAGITDPAVLPVVLSRLDEILSNEPPNWDDANSWTDYVGKAKQPSAEELARFHAELACADTEGTIAGSMAGRAIESATEPFGKAYAKAFAATLLDENCKGGRALTPETRATLKDLASAPE
jgi:uncharacterized protein YjbI with pentapeptide repeats